MQQNYDICSSPNYVQFGLLLFIHPFVEPN